LPLPYLIPPGKRSRHVEQAITQMHLSPIVHLELATLLRGGRVYSG
jgi:hypothetical protein